MISKKMNLLPMRYQEKYIVDVNSFLKKAGLALAMFFGILIISLATLNMYNAKLDLMMTESRYEIIRQQVSQIDGLQSELKTLEGEWAKNALLVQKDVSFSRILKDIQANTPADIWYINLIVSLDDGRWDQLAEFNPDSGNIDPDMVDEYREELDKLSAGARVIEINGYGQSFSSVGALAYLLNQIDYLENVVIGYSAEIDIEDQKLVEFSLSGQIKEMK